MNVARVSWEALGGFGHEVGRDAMFNANRFRKVPYRYQMYSSTSGG